jgi:rhodanese-related sulfurtransferase
MAENLHALGLEVSVIEMGNQILAPVDFPIAAIVQQHIRSKGVSLFLNNAVTGFEKSGEKLVVNLKTGNSLEADVVILSIGVKPDTKLAVSAGITIGDARGIKVNEYLQTSNPDIYAVGDAIEFANPITGQSLVTYLAGPANKQGRICANNIVLGNVQKYNGSINTAIVKVFDMTVAAAGMAVKHLKLSNVKHIVSTTHNGAHAGYYPGAGQMTMQIAFDPESGQLYSAQIAGYEGVDKRIDLLSSIIKRKSTIYELIELEHAYAPPFSSAKDPVNMAGFVAENIMLERLRVFYWNEIDKIKADDVFIDVRRDDEFQKGNIKGAVNIPVDEIRNRMIEIPKDKNIFIYCEAGLRGYLAQRILLQNGYASVQNLSGGYKLWKAATEEVANAESTQMASA